MKDQRLLLRKSRLNNIPAIIFQGRDVCAVNIVKSAEETYQKNGCGVEFLYDFNRLTKYFETYFDENKDILDLPTLDSFSDKQVLNECIYTDIPVIVFQGTDSCAIEILKCAEEIYLNTGCNTKFLTGFQSLIETFEEYEQRNTSSIKVPQLLESERDFVREDMEHDFISAVATNNLTNLKQMVKLGYQPSSEVIQSLASSFSESTLITVQKLFRFGINSIPNLQPTSESFDKKPPHLVNDMEQSI